MNLKLKTLVMAAALAILCAGPASASTIVINNPLWYEFQFSAAPGAAFAFAGNDAPGFAQPTESAPWEFVFGPGGGNLKVTDAFSLINRFEVFDFGVSLGLTSIPGGSSFNCGANPNTCFGTVAASRQTFFLAGGSHSITINSILTGTTGGGGYFQANGAVPLPSAVPEPATVALVAVGLSALVARRHCRRLVGDQLPAPR